MKAKSQILAVRETALEFLREYDLISEERLSKLKREGILSQKGRIYLYKNPKVIGELLKLLSSVPRFYKLNNGVAFFLWEVKT